VGDHLRKARLDRGLSKEEVAELFGVEVKTVGDWERGRKEPRVWYLPRIIAFLGYDPLPQGASLGERLRGERKRRGLTQHQLARLLDTTQAMVSLLETGGEVTNARVLAAVRRFVEGEE
jgi:transcriptional regulator with XRE-family HTH domain